MSLNLLCATASARIVASALRMNGSTSPCSDVALRTQPVTSQGQSLSYSRTHTGARKAREGQNAQVDPYLKFHADLLRLVRRLKIIARLRKNWRKCVQKRSYCSKSANLGINTSLALDFFCCDKGKPKINPLIFLTRLFIIFVLNKPGWTYFCDVFLCD